MYSDAVVEDDDPVRLPLWQARGSFRKRGKAGFQTQDAASGA